MTLKIYLDLFIPIKGYQYLSKEERSLIAKSVVMNVLRNRQVSLDIDNYLNNNPLKIISKFIKKDDSGLLEGEGKEARVARFKDLADIEKKKDALQEIIREWIRMQDA